MSKREDGATTVAVLFIVVVFLLIGSLGFAIWAFSSRQDYKNNSDQKIAVAVQNASDQLTTKLDTQFAIKEASPYSVYQTPLSLGGVTVTYPKNWSGYVTSASDLLDAYFYPNIVPDITNESQTFALRISIQSQQYSDVVSSLTGSGSDQGMTVSAYSFPKVPGQVGMELNGAIESNKTGLMVIMPVRNDTLEVFTEGSQFINDFENIILPNLTFSP